MKKLLLKTMLLLCALVAGNGTMWAEDEVVYTLTPATGTNNTYGGYCDITIENITWNITGNSTMIPWRIGGKGITNVNRELYSKTAISDNITKIEVTHGTASSITVNSWTLIVSKNSDFSNPVSTLTPTFAASTTTTITRPDGADWSDCYFKFVYNVTVSGSSNKFIEFTEAKFYKSAAPAYTITALSNNENYGTVSLSGSVITANPNSGYRVSTSTPYTVSPTNSATVVQNGNEFTVTPSSDCTVTINFEAIPTHTVTFSVNGITSSATVAEGEAISFPSGPADVNGMKFMGWYTSTYENETVAPAFVESATMGDSDVTYYAVFATRTVSTQEETKTFGFETASDDDWTIDGPVRNNSRANTGTYSGKINTNNTYVTFDNKVKVTEFSFAFTRISTNSNYNVYIETSNDNSSWTAVETYAMSSFNSNGTFSTRTKTFDGNTELYVRFHCYNTTAERYVDDVTVKYNVEADVYSNYCTTVPEPAITLSTPTVEATALGAEGTITVTYTDFNTEIIADVEWYTDATAATTASKPNWIEAEINSDKNLEYLIDANTGAARTAYLKVYALDVNADEVYSELITITQAAATVTATVGAKGFATFVSDKALDFTGKSIKAYTIDSTDGSALTLTQKNEVAANEPVLLYSETNSDSQAIPVIATATADSNNKLVKGTGAAITWSETNQVYVLNTTNTPAFYRANNSPVATDKAYLDLTGVSESRSIFTLNIDGDVQGISNVNSETMNNNRYFDMQGRRVAQPTKGLYIMNGKKVLVK